jgi:hypothetical protein
MQKSFLNSVAEFLYHKHGDELQRQLLLFPSGRNILFFRKALAEIAGKPIWAPGMQTINGWIRSFHPSQTPDDLALNIRLHQCWKALGQQDSFESFFTLGQLLLKEFDDIDKALAHRDNLFRQLRELPVLNEAALENIDLH